VKKATYCVYLITHHETGKCYVGMTSLPIERRWSMHMCQARWKLRASPVAKAIHDYGPGAFDCDILHGPGLSRDQACDLEKAEIKARRTQDPQFGYNVLSGGLDYEWPENVRPQEREAWFARLMENSRKQTFLESRQKQRATYDAIAATRPFCKNGHPYTAENIRINAQGVRVCRLCHREASRRSYGNRGLFTERQ